MGCLGVLKIVWVCLLSLVSWPLELTCSRLVLLFYCQFVLEKGWHRLLLVVSCLGIPLVLPCKTAFWQRLGDISSQQSRHCPNLFCCIMKTMSFHSRWLFHLKYIPKGKSVRKLAYKILFHVKSLKASVEFIHPNFFILKISPVQ